MTAPISLAALRAARAKMTPGEWEAVDEFVYDPEHAVIHAIHNDDNAAGIVATHSAADVLIEITEAAQTWRDTRWRQPADAAESALFEALAKVTP